MVGAPSVGSARLKVDEGGFCSLAGGSCTCPDGSEYHAARLTADPTKLACFGGVAGAAHESHGAWSNVKVDCNVCGDCNGPYQNIVTEHSAEAGGWGGECTCPDGVKYEVGDYNDACGSLACHGGAITKQCQAGGISSANHGMKVTCAVPKTAEIGRAHV